MQRAPNATAQPPITFPPTLPPTSPPLPAALKFLELFRHLQQQAFKHDLAFEGRQLEVLALMTRADVMHKLGGARLSRSPP